MTRQETKFRLLPCLDSAEMSACRERELNIPRDSAAALGRSAVDAATKGHYIDCAGMKVDWSRDVQAACRAKRSVHPDDPLPSHEHAPFSETTIQITNETTLGASLRLTERGLRPLALNFANGIYPGGGFLRGARAQEEVLCRSSALYQTLVDDPMYEEHRKRQLPDSTDWAIYSPDVPIFRADDGMETQKPWVLSVITCAAPYAPAVGQPTAGMLLRRRIHRVLAIAQAYEHSALVLGAWGCGAFRNDPQRTAVDFRQALLNEYRGAFSDIVFAIADWSPERKFLGPFRDNFRPGLFVSIPDELAQDPWYKVVDFLQQNWAVVIATGGDSVLVVFYGDTSGIFDELEFRTREEAEKALLRNGFSKYQEDTKSHQFIGLPQGNFHAGEHPNGRIYSSGRFWR